ARGRVELRIVVQLRQAPILEVEFNEQFGRALEAALEQARARGLVTGVLSPGDLLRLPQALSIRERLPGDDESTAAALMDVARQLLVRALTTLDSMRIREGEHLRADLDARKAHVAELVERIAVAADEGRAAMEQRLIERVAELRTVLQADDTLVAQEIARTAARADISEETARFRGHVAHWDALTAHPDPCGRKLDFLLQEMNREVNTMGSKADGLRVSELIIAAKAELEKMREQVQNVE
ncbi:MAG: YicC family protein, partial [Vicinamibacterales bacterium]